MKKKVGFIAGFIVLIALSLVTCISVYNKNKATELFKKIFAQDIKIVEINLKDIYKEDFIKRDPNKITDAWDMYNNENKKIGFGLIVKTQGYNGEITVAVGIDRNTSKIMGIDILSQKETPHYGNYIVEKWFTDRFTNKNAEAFLNLKSLEASDEQDIVQVTGATMSSKAVVDAVNTAICAYNYIELNKKIEKQAVNIQNEKKGEEESFNIKYDGNKSVKITMEDLKSFSREKVSCTLNKTTGTKIDMVAEGPLLETVLNKYGISMKDYEGIGITGRDGYYALVSKDIMKNRKIILGYIFDGKDIIDDEKPIRVVIPGEFGVYWVKTVSDIELYSDIPEKEIKSVKIFNSLARDIKPYMFEYYGNKDKAIEVGKLLAKFKNVNPKGFFTMASSDGLVKNETIAMVNQRYYIKIDGKDAPMNVMANFKLGSNVKHIAYFSTTEDAVIFPEEMIKLTGKSTINSHTGMLLDKVLSKAGITQANTKKFELKDVSGVCSQIDGKDLGKCVLVYEGDKVNAYIKADSGTIAINDLLEINEVK